MALTAVGLMGLCGLRPTEAIRLQAQDVAEDVLSVGVRERKNAMSRRDLPMPKHVATWVDRCIEGQASEDVYPTLPEQTQCRVEHLSKRHAEQTAVSKNGRSDDWSQTADEDWPS